MKTPEYALTQRLRAVIATLALCTFSTVSYSSETIIESLKDGQVSANLQYRYESVRNPGKAVPNNADAQTVRLRLGYETAAFKYIRAMVEAEAVRTVFGGNQYDSKACTTASGCTNYAVVADPASTELNQAYLSYGGISNTVAKWGRQRLVLDNARFIGNVGWRQNEQTFDAFTVVNNSLPSTKITAAHITNVNRVFSDSAIVAATGVPATGAFGGNHKMSSNILNVNYKGWSRAELVGYAYLLDYDVSSGFTANSTDTYGFRASGKTPVGRNKLLFTAEFATQSNAKLNNAVNYRVDYSFLEAGLDVTSAVFKLGHEVLGSNGNTVTSKPFSTPLATLHAFNGWADLFLTTPARGLKDTYVSAGTTFAGVKLGAAYHDFRAAKPDATADNYGTEWDLVASKTFDTNYTIGAKMAQFSTKLPATYANTNKFWVWAEAKF